MPRILGIDLGTTLGHAVVDTEPWVRIEDSGFLDLSGGEARRFDRALVHLSDLVATHRPDLVAYEEVQHLQKGVAAASVYWGMRAVLLLVCLRSGTPLEGYHLAKIKQRATGKGNADKAEMVTAARSWVNNCEDHNEADALFVALLAADQERT